MQRRAAALYFALFLVIGAGSFAYVTMDNGVNAQKPTIDLNAKTYSNGDIFTVDGRTYVVSKVKQVTKEAGGEGGGTRQVMQGSLKWTNQSAQATATLENGTNTTYKNESWQVTVANQSNVSQFTLRENFNVSAILASDDRVENKPVTHNGEPNVVFKSNNSLKPLSEYLREPETKTFAEGDPFNYTADDGSVEQATVQAVTGNVSTPSVTLAWTTSKENTIELTEGANVTLNGEKRVVHFPDTKSVQFGSNIESYHTQARKEEYFHERKSGLWGIVIISFAAAIVLLASAYLPVKD